MDAEREARGRATYIRIAWYGRGRKAINKRSYEMQIVCFGIFDRHKMQNGHLKNPPRYLDRKEGIAMAVTATKYSVLKRSELEIDISVTNVQTQQNRQEVVGF